MNLEKTVDYSMMTLGFWLGIESVNDLLGTNLIETQLIWILCKMIVIGYNSLKAGKSLDEVMKDAEEEIDKMEGKYKNDTIKK